ncbi:MAG: hypothetical protein A2Z91_01840 [Deltaproteobacteria bacterium GWA2_38_16]|nr:MAG: hypothetical protein A2Z91_01840 [Deltaproteobacteria bacterium GWA2_38_16]OGQ01940.1 MAG: hypothetical protein A3D19_08135 [Deltaproteobacteria bacterium RIFCSPHIGHO2_02_FULL_38_15]OGQ34945.1 MAG: hypothetical protein A3A72_06200 [Deltaproteobacteria bacterium RIFCSPLOWO2_01_FULL_38_9]HBQ21284.1 hypothetical protein [Deltaproteobacteria bacterium]
MKKNLFVLSFLGVLFSYHVASAAITRIEIPFSQKNVTLSPGSWFKFECTVWDNEEGQKLNVPLTWVIEDVGGFETTLPGWIDETGFFRADSYFLGRFKVVVTEPVSHLRDEANVQITQNPPYPYEIFRIEVFPNTLNLTRGSSAYLNIHCYNGYGERVFNYTLRYYLRDMFGRLTPSFVRIDPPGIIYASSWMPQGSYTLYFEDVNGSARTTVQLNVW